MPNPFFSVIIPAYNLEQYIAVTIQSVLDQTFKDFEIIIVDDGSTDKTVSVIQSFHDPRIRLISQPNGGVSKARNTGIQIANGKYIAFLDGDDFWYPEHLMLAFEFFKRHSNILVYVSRYLMSELITIPPRVSSKPTFIRKLGILGLLCIHSSSIILNSSLVSQLPPWEENMSYGEDGLYWTRLMRKTNILGQGGSITSVYRQRLSSVMHNGCYQTESLQKIILPLLDEIEAMERKTWQFAIHYKIIVELHPYKLLALDKRECFALLQRINKVMHPYLNRPAFNDYIQSYPSEHQMYQSFNVLTKRAFLLCKWLGRLEIAIRFFTFS